MCARLFWDLVLCFENTISSVFVALSLLPAQAQVASLGHLVPMGPNLDRGAWGQSVCVRMGAAVTASCVLAAVLVGLRLALTVGENGVVVAPLERCLWSRSLLCEHCRDAAVCVTSGLSPLALPVRPICLALDTSSFHPLPDCGQRLPHGPALSERCAGHPAVPKPLLGPKAASRQLQKEVCGVFQ